LKDEPKPSFNQVPLFVSQMLTSDKARCRLHGGMSLSGHDHPNYRHGHATKAYRKQLAESNAFIKHLEFMLIELGAIAPKRKKRNTMF